MRVSQQVFKLKFEEIRPLFNGTSLVEGDDLDQETFTKIYVDNCNHPLFSWMENLGNAPKNLMTGNKDLPQSLDYEAKKAPTKSSSTEFTAQEESQLQKFFKDITAQGSTSSALTAINKKLDGVKIPETLKVRIVHSFFLSSREKRCLSFTNFKEIISKLCKTQNLSDRLGYLFDIYSAYEAFLSWDDAQEFIDVFFSQHDVNDVKKIREVVRQECRKKGTKSWFIERFTGLEGDYHILNNLNAFLYLDLGVRPASTEEELQLIRSSISECSSIRDYIKHQMEEGETFYMVDYGFWGHWCEYTGFGSTTTRFSM